MDGRVIYHNAGPENYSPVDPGPTRAPITKWLHARLAQVKEQTEAGAVGWHKLLTRPVTPQSKQPLKAQRDKLRKTHKIGWQFRVLSDDVDGQRVHVLWAHYDVKGGKGERESKPPAAASDGVKRELTPVRPQGESERREASTAPPLAPPAPPFEGALRGMEWAQEDDNGSQ